jgi:hypothetical protein
MANGGLLTKWQGGIVFARVNEWFLNSDDSFLYYSNRNDGNRLTRKENPGEEGEALLKTSCAGVVLFDDGIFYIDENDRRVYRCSTSGRGAARCSNKETTAFAVLDNGEVYINPDARRMCAAGEKIYFADAANDFALTCIELPRGEKEVFANIKPSYLNVYGDELFYTDRMRENKIFRLGSRFSISSESAEYLHVIDDWLYFMADKNWKRISLINFGEAEDVEYWNSHDSPG